MPRWNYQIILALISFLTVQGLLFGQVCSAEPCNSRALFPASHMDVVVGWTTHVSNLLARSGSRSGSSALIGPAISHNPHTGSGYCAGFLRYAGPTGSVHDSARSERTLWLLNRAFLL